MAKTYYLRSYGELFDWPKRLSSVPVYKEGPARKRLALESTSGRHKSRKCQSPKHKGQKDGRSSEEEQMACIQTTTKGRSVSSTTESSNLQEVLKEFSSSTEGVSEKQLRETIFKLPYFALGHFTNRGGHLHLEKYNVHLYIPRGAIPEKQLQKVYIYVNPKAPPVDGIDLPNVALAPVVQCGPPGLTFLDSVVLSFPHHAHEKSEWQLKAQICPDAEAASKNWKTLDERDDGTMVSTKGKKAIVLLNHFTGVTLVGQPSPDGSKIVKVRPFGRQHFDLSEREYAARIHLWNDDPSAKQVVEEMEGDMNSGPLDACRDLEVSQKEGDVIVKILNVRDGWITEPSCAGDTILKKSRIWRFPTNSVTCNLTRHAASPANPDAAGPGFDGEVYQRASESDVAWNDDKIHVSVRPQSASKANGGTESPTRYDLRSRSPKRRGKLQFQREVHGEMDGDYGGLPEETVYRLCELLDPERGGGNNWIQLAEYLLDERKGSIESAQRNLQHPTKTVLKVHFSKCKEAGVSDKDAVEQLILAFEKFHMERGAEIVREALK